MVFLFATLRGTIDGETEISGNWWLLLLHSISTSLLTLAENEQLLSHFQVIGLASFETMQQLAVVLLQ